MGLSQHSPSLMLQDAPQLLTEPRPESTEAVPCCGVPRTESSFGSQTFRAHIRTVLDSRMVGHPSISFLYWAPKGGHLRLSQKYNMVLSIQGLCWVLETPQQGSVGPHNLGPEALLCATPPPGCLDSCVVVPHHPGRPFKFPDPVVHSISNLSQRGRVGMMY